MFHRVGPAAYKADLSNTIALMDELDHPYRAFPSIHIAGTNGKGSTSHMLAAVLQQAGYKTGLYTSPHLLDFRERIRINGEMIPQENVIQFVGKHRVSFEEIRPSFFEWTVALAFDFFRQEKIDIAVIETGLGGRLDSTNVITPAVAVITNIGWDHAALLGGTLPEIAGEKAGIIKSGVPTVIGERQQATEAVFIQKAGEQSSGLHWASDHWRIERISHAPQEQRLQIRSWWWAKEFTLTLDLPGLYQLKNTGTVLETIAVLKEQGWQIEDAHIFEGLSKVRHSTGFMGRWQLLADRPRVFADVAHNADGMREINAQLSGMQYERLHVVTGMVKDKDVSGLLELMPKQADYYFCSPALPRALPVDELASKAAALGLKGKAHPDVISAVNAAWTQADENDLVVIAGSTFVVAEALPLFTGK